MLSVKGLHAFYGRAHILQGVSLEARAGEVVALLGRNGAGKSTALKSIMGLVPAARGEVTFLSLLQAQRILTETELAFVESQADRWNGAVAIASLLQLEQFPPEADAPAVIPTNDADSELNQQRLNQPAAPAAQLAPPAGQPVAPPARLPAVAAPLQQLPAP